MAAANLYVPEEFENSLARICLGEKKYNSKSEAVTSTVVIEEDEDKPCNILLVPCYYEPEDNAFFASDAFGEISCDAHNLREIIISERQESRRRGGATVDFDATNLRQKDGYLLITFEQGDEDEKSSFAVSVRRHDVNQKLMPFLSRVITD